MRDPGDEVTDDDSGGAAGRERRHHAIDDAGEGLFSRRRATCGSSLERVARADLPGIESAVAQADEVEAQPVLGVVVGAGVWRRRDDARDAAVGDNVGELARVFRGGSSYSDPNVSRTGFRYYVTPDDDGIYHGVRCARAL